MKRAGNAGVRCCRGETFFVGRNSSSLRVVKDGTEIDIVRPDADMERNQ
jgi:hypothetical protein